MVSAVSRQVVSVGIAASYLQNYHGGIFDGYCGGSVNHAVNVVGYASNFIKLRNSWGTRFGEQGYMRFARGRNQCQVNADISYP